MRTLLIGLDHSGRYYQPPLTIQWIEVTTLEDVAKKELQVANDRVEDTNKWLENNGYEPNEYFDKVQFMQPDGAGIII